MAFVDELICPITRDLPINPVMACDGRVYEKEAIQRFLMGKPEFPAQVNSPFTNGLMDRRLLPAPQHKNIIEMLIQNGTIAGEPAKKWKERKQMEKLLKAAKEGDPDSMGKTASNYFFGLESFDKDSDKAYFWCTKAHAAGSVVGTAILGGILSVGRREQGLMYLGLAAKGSDYASCILGSALLENNLGLHTDLEEGRRLLNQSLSEQCTFAHMPASMKADASKLLDQLDAFVLQVEDASVDDTEDNDSCVGVPPHILGGPLMNDDFGGRFSDSSDEY